MEHLELSFNRDEPIPPQTADWTCSACSLAWALRALSLWNDCSEWTAVDAIGTPENINSVVGLCDGSGAALATVMRRYTVPAFCLWPSNDQLAQLVSQSCVLIGGTQWYHWVGIRDVDDGGLYIANSAPGWMGVQQTLAWGELQSLGPFAAVCVPLLQAFPPPTTAESVSDGGD